MSFIWEEDPNHDDNHTQQIWGVLQVFCPSLLAWPENVASRIVKEDLKKRDNGKSTISHKLAQHPHQPHAEFLTLVLDLGAGLTVDTQVVFHAAIMHIYALRLLSELNYMGWFFWRQRSCLIQLKVLLAESWAFTCFLQKFIECMNEQNIFLTIHIHIRK